MSKLQVFRYKGQNISFDFRNENRMINATEMAKAFNGKLPADFLRLKQTKDFIDELKSQYGNSHIGKIIKVIKGGIYSGTWMCEKLALKFAAWLSAKFEIWVFDKIQELLLKGHVSLKPALPQSITYIYFIKAVSLNRVKIGMTENIHQRIINLKANSPDELELLKVVRTNSTYPTDHAIHALFSHLRVRGEWFSLTSEMQNFIEQLETNVSETKRTALYYERRISELQLHITELQQRLFKNKQLIHQLTRELGQVQRQYRDLQNQPPTTLHLPISNSSIPPITTLEVENPTKSTQHYSKVLFMAKGNKWEGVKVKDIIYLQGQKRFTRIICKEQVQYEVPQTMNQLLEQLPEKPFIQIHRSYVIHLKYLTNITPKENILLMDGNIELPISRGKFPHLVERIKVLKRR